MAKTKKEKPKLWIPFDKDGDLLEWVDQGQWDMADPVRREEMSNRKYNPIFAKENYSFDAKLKFRTFSWGRSAGRAIFTDENGKEYSMFVGEFGGLVAAGRMNGEYIEGKWTFAKKGQNYGLVEAK